MFSIVKAHPIYLMYKHRKDPLAVRIIFKDYFPIIETLTKRRYIQIRGLRITELHSKIFLWCVGHFNTKQESRTIYDHLGPIDTLGFRREIGPFHGSFSSELEYVTWLNVWKFTAIYYHNEGFIRFCITKPIS